MHVNKNNKMNTYTNKNYALPLSFFKKVKLRLFQVKDNLFKKQQPNQASQLTFSEKPMTSRNTDVAIYRAGTSYYYK